MASKYLTSQEAASYLGVTRATLYAYVSRGMIRAVQTEADSRRKRYPWADLEKLKRVHRDRQDGQAADDESIGFGHPVMATSISLVTDEEHSYRGTPSRVLADTSTFERTAEYLWTGETAAGSTPERPRLPEPRAEWRAELDLSPIHELPAYLPAVERFQCLVPLLERNELGAYGTRPDVLVPTAIRIMKYLTWLSAETDFSDSIASTLGAAWNVDADLIERVLIVTADHELNIATFTARCVASAGGNVFQAVLAGLAALQGNKHLFGQVADSKRFFREVLHSGDPEATLRQQLRRHGTAPGFHNPYRRLYTGRDPRVRTLLENLRGTDGHDALEETVRAVEAATGEYPRIDFALAASEVLLRLPHDAIFNVAAIARTAGMIAHAIEQYGTGRVIRPRAHYVPSEHSTDGAPGATP